MPLPNALTIAGFDPSGGAGALADARTFAAYGYRASAAITSITFQNDHQTTGAAHQTAASVRGQIESLLGDLQFACTKTGMLPTRELVHEVARIFCESELPAPVVDPVMVSSSGLLLMDRDALETFMSEMLPLSRLVTPNISEAEALSGLVVSSESEMREAAKIIRGFGARAVLIKGGHLPGATDFPEDAIDVLDAEGIVTVFRAVFIPGANIRGSGCILSAAIASGLGKGMSLEDSVRQAKDLVLSKLHRQADR